MSFSAGALQALHYGVERGGPFDLGGPNFQYVKRGGRYFETVVPLVSTDSHSAIFEIVRAGDLAHTFVLKGRMPEGCTDIDALFSDIVLYEESECDCAGTRFPMKTYTERMSLRANNTLARASGMPPSISPNGFFSIPLMLRETVAPDQTHLPFVALGGGTCYLVVNGVNRDAFGGKSVDCGLDVTYVYLEMPARRELANSTDSMPMLICDYVTTPVESLNIQMSLWHKINLKWYDGSATVPNRVTGLILHMPNSTAIGWLHSISLELNNCAVLEWKPEDREFSWQKVGLKDPQNGDILIPFSREMWNHPENAASIDLSRMNSAMLRLKFATIIDEVAEEGRVDVQVTALGYEVRVLDPKKHILADRLHFGEPIEL